MIPVCPKRFEDDDITRHRHNRCESVCYVTPKGGGAHSFCPFYVVQVRPSKSELKEFCDAKIFLGEGGRG